MSDKTNLQDIIRKCIDGDRSAQKHLYLFLSDELMSVAYRYTRDMDFAKDVVQHAFVRIFHNLGSYDADKSGITTWSKKICIHEAISFLRKHKKMMIYVDINDVILPFQKEYEDETFSPEILRGKIDKLPEEHRMIIQLYYYDELSHKEIATLLNIQESSSRSRLSRAKDQLRINWKAALFF
jgi:RNA polymerase sigma-70 factor (ECF subfamily)